MASNGEKPTSAEPDASTNNLAKSFEDRLQLPDNSKSTTNGTNVNATTFTPGKFDWADEVTTPVKETQNPPAAREQKSDAPQSQTDGATGDSLAMSQKDGSSAWLGGGEGLEEPEFDVDVKLADLQDDPNNPLYSAQSFEQLNL